MPKDSISDCQNEHKNEALKYKPSTQYASVMSMRYVRLSEVNKHANALQLAKVNECCVYNYTHNVSTVTLFTCNYY